MIRVDGKEYNAHGYIDTDGTMNIEFESNESLDEINAAFSDASCIEVVESYELKAVNKLSVTNGSPRTISIKLSIAPVMAEDTAEYNAPTAKTAEDYKAEVKTGTIKLEDVPAEYRDKVAIMLGV